MLAHLNHVLAQWMVVPYDTLPLPPEFTRIHFAAKMFAEDVPGTPRDNKRYQQSDDDSCHGHLLSTSHTQEYYIEAEVGFEPTISGL